MGVSLSTTRWRMRRRALMPLVMLVASFASSAGCSKPPAPSTSPSTSASTQPVPPPAAPAPPPVLAAKSLPTCGDKPLPPCPLYAWMKANTSAAMSAKDFPGLVAALDEVARFAPPAYTDWGSIARDGASAARVQNLDAVKAACRGCHAQYRDRYKKEMRDQKLPL